MTITAAQYREAMAKIDAGSKISASLHAEMTEFARVRKVRRPSPDAISTSDTCASEDCERDVRSKGLCSQHYTAERRKNPELMQRARDAANRYAAKKREEKKELATVSE